MSQNTNTAIATDLATERAALEAQQAELEARIKDAQRAEKDREWEHSVKYVGTAKLPPNEQYVLGSLRRPTESDIASFEGRKVHGRVCEIECARCSKRRIVNTQDARQCRYCLECKAEAKKAEAKAKRAAAKQLSPDEMKAQIAEMQAKLAAMEAEAEAHVAS